MLIQDFYMRDPIKNYANFYSSLTWFRLYCLGKYGGSKSDYVKGFEKIKSQFETLYEFHDKDEFVGWKKELAIKLISDLEIIFKSKKLTEAQISKVATLIWNFQSNGEEEFRDDYIDDEIKHIKGLAYPKELYDTVNDLLAREANEEAVIQAFKFLDNHIQKTLSISAHELYGEELINRAFSPNSGLLQLGTHQNEQIGLRNFFSGANALFRNASAHRFVDYDDFDAGAIVAMVAMMADLVSRLAARNLDKKENPASSN